MSLHGKHNSELAVASILPPQGFVTTVQPVDWLPIVTISIYGQFVMHKAHSINATLHTQKLYFLHKRVIFDTLPD